MRSELVGRDREIGALDGWLASTLGGEPRLVLCHGEPGAGKTRLAEELVVRAAALEVPTLWGRAAEAEGAPPYWLWRQVLRGATGVARLAGELGVAEELAPLVPELDGGRSDALGDEARFRLFDAVVGVLREIADARGLVVVLDDVHWADRPSLLLLRHLTRELRGSRLLVLATHHDLPTGDAPLLAELVREPVTERLPLTGLSRNAVAARLAAEIGEPVTAELVGRVHELTGGNPFFVGELARHLSTGRAAGIPPTVREAIERRMERLSPCCRRQLRAASIVGRQFSVAVVAATIGRPVLDCLDPLDEAVAAGLVEPTATAGDEYRFVHALVRDAVEAGLPTGERVRLHRAAVEAIERLYSDRLDPHLSDLARHWAAAAMAGERARAAGWIEQAGDEAMRRLAFEEGARLYRLALDTGDPELDGLTRHRLLVALADARHRSADGTGSAEACLAAADVARELGRPDLLGDAVLVLGCVNEQGADRRLRALCEEALAGLDGQPSSRRARLLSLLAETHMYLEDVGPADVASREALAVADACAEPAALVAALRARQMARSGPDGIEERATLTARLLAVGSDADNPSDRMWAHLWQIDTHVERGDLFDAAAVIDRLEWYAGRVGGPTGRWHVLKARAALAQAHGRFDDARVLADQAFAVAPASGHAGAVGARMALLTALDHHAGTDHGGTTAMVALDAAGGAVAAGSGYRITYTLGPAVILTDAGRLDEAGALYRSLGPPRRWRPPPFFLLVSYAAGIAVAVGQNAGADVAVLRELLAPYRHRHVGSGAGVAHYGGPVALHLGIAAGHLGDLDAAVDDLRLALASCRENGAAGYAVEAQVELAGVLARRGRPEDLDEARALVTAGTAAARGLGMSAFAARMVALGTSLGPVPPSPSLLTAREREVAACLSTGMSNPQIAAALFVSERTAQNHVQHILSKLGYSRRSQIAVWAVQNLDPRTPSDRRA